MHFRTRSDATVHFHPLWMSVSAREVRKEGKKGKSKQLMQLRNIVR
jgi:hypothetical protein